MKMDPLQWDCMIFVICLTTLLASFLTFFSGFGLGTLLMPVIAIFFPVPMAIAMTAVVHFLSKIFKVVLLRKHIDFEVVLKFGVPAMLAAIPGAALLGQFSNFAVLLQYEWGAHVFVVTPLKLLMGLLLIFFATAEVMPLLQQQRFLKMGWWVGGVLSGFFGGLSGHQGAFRSAFLVRAIFSEKQFVATHAVIAVMVDVVRLCIYGLTFNVALLSSQGTLMLWVVLAAYAGILLGNRLLHKVTLAGVQKIVMILMYVLGVLLCAGVI
jgi:uncharacterized membrane protein YfcA